MNIKDQYAIAGVGYTAQGAVPDRTALSFHVEACANAVKDAGVSKNEIDGLILYRQFQAVSNESPIMPYLVSQNLGITPTYMSMDAN